MFKEKFHVVHLNLAIALLFALIMFVSGVETAKSNRVRTNYTIQYILHGILQVACIVVTSVLHYLFLAVFSWAICEGIIIYVLFVALFYKGIFQRLYVLLVIGWGKQHLCFIVIIVCN